MTEQAPLSAIAHIGIQGLGYMAPGFTQSSGQAPPGVGDIGIPSPGAYLTPAFMLICGVLLWSTPIARIYHALLAILLALWSWTTSNLGGFLIGMLLGAVGGALAFAWRTDAQYESSGLLRANSAIGLLSRPLDVISRLKAWPTRERAERAVSGLIDIGRGKMLGRRSSGNGRSLLGKVAFFVRWRQSPP